MQSSVFSLSPGDTRCAARNTDAGNADSVAGVTRILLSRPPYRDGVQTHSWLGRGVWPCRWICCAEDRPLPWVAVYRRTFSLDDAETIRVHVAADERYELFADGRFAGRGGERGDPRYWFFDTYDLRLGAGSHTLAARVWTLGKFAPRAQMSLMPGFLLSPDEERWAGALGTGVAAWEGKLLDGYAFEPPFAHPFYSIGHNVAVTAQAADGDWRRGGGEGWRMVRKLHAGSDAEERTRVGGEHLLVPAMLPGQLSRWWRTGLVRHSQSHSLLDTTKNPAPYHEAEHDDGLAQAWDRLWRQGAPLVVPPRTRMRVLFDFETYVCAWPSLAATGGDGAEIRLSWAESLFCEPADSTGREGQIEAMEKAKGRRDEIEGKFFCGIGDRFCLPAGGRNGRNGAMEPAEFLFDTPFWRAGRYLEITVATGGEALEIQRLDLVETRYPLEAEGFLDCGDERVARLFKKAARTFEVSCHDAYVDPYYEQMMWAGDGLQNILVNFVMYRDARLARKWLKMLHVSRLPSGLVCARHPAKDSLLIAPYALYWVQGLKEYAWWRDDEPFVRELLPAAREILQVFERFVDSSTGCLKSPPGWGFVDWVPGWKAGVPAGAGRGETGSILTWHWIVALVQAAELEASLGEHEMAARHRRIARQAAASAMATFWQEERGLFSDDLDATSFSEHAQCFAISSGLLEPEQEARVGAALLAAGEGSLHRATISFSHHLFEAYRRLGRTDRLLERLELWFGLDDLGLLTLPEGPEPSRSDCHSWSTHPVYHFYASFLGVRPAGRGFRRVRIEPRLGPFNRIRARMPHPDGFIGVDLARESGSEHVRGTITLPRDVEGEVVFEGAAIPVQRFSGACPVSFSSRPSVPVSATGA